MNDETEAQKTNKNPEGSGTPAQPNTNETEANSHKKLQAIKDFFNRFRSKEPWVRPDKIQSLILIIGAVYCIVTVLLWCAARNANRISREGVANADRNFRIDERAWIGFKFVEGTMTFTIGKSFLVPTELVNSGKTPAKNTHGNIVVGVFRKGEPLNFDYSPGHGNTNYAVQAGTIFPNGGITESFEALEHGIGQKQPLILTPAIKDQLFSGESYLIVHGKIEYWDVFGKYHWTTYCRYVLHPEIISPECMHYNDTDKN